MRPARRGVLIPFATTVVLLAADSARGSSQVVPPAAAPANSVTFVGNSGFLLRAGGKAILIDALFDGFPGAYTNG